MNRIRTWLTAGFLLFLLAVILLTWGSIGSAVLTLALLLALGYLLLRSVLQNRDPDDFDWNL